MPNSHRVYYYNGVVHLSCLKVLADVTSAQKCASKLRRSRLQCAAMSRVKNLGGVDISTAGICPIFIVLRNNRFPAERFHSFKIQYWRRERISIYLHIFLSHHRTVTLAVPREWAPRSPYRREHLCSPQWRGEEWMDEFLHLDDILKGIPFPST